MKNCVCYIYIFTSFLKIQKKKTQKRKSQILSLYLFPFLVFCNTLKSFLIFLCVIHDIKIIIQKIENKIGIV